MTEREMYVEDERVGTVRFNAVVCDECGNEVPEERFFGYTVQHWRHHSRNIVLSHFCSIACLADRANEEANGLPLPESVLI